jgi:hypothetical protein
MDHGIVLTWMLCLALYPRDHGSQLPSQAVITMNSAISLRPPITIMDPSRLDYHLRSLPLAVFDFYKGAIARICLPLDNIAKRRQIASESCSVQF